MQEAPQSVLLIISGSVASYKALELVRLLRARGVTVEAVLTKGGAEFITPLAVSSLTGTKTYTDLFSLTDEVEMGHIQLSRRHDLVLVAPASADLLAKMANGLCDDLASTLLLATDKPVFAAPAMNPRMWEHPATQRNLRQLEADGVRIIQPRSGEMACGETGTGRMAEPQEIVEAIMKTAAELSVVAPRLEEAVAAPMSVTRPLAGRKAIVTAGPTQEPIDPVRFIGNHSSGKQGIAIAKALAAAGAEVHLVLGPTGEAAPEEAEGVATHRVTTAREMLAEVETLLPADLAVCTAAVADWSPAEPAAQKIKKLLPGQGPKLRLQENPDILAWLSQKADPRPALVVGFAAETENLLENARAKWRKKSCDWLFANDVSEGKVFHAEETELHWFKDSAVPELWRGGKSEIAVRLAKEIAGYFSTAQHSKTPAGRKETA